ncbi:MAG TPA: phosphate ABC transporter permease PstA [Gemmataceae bacterium]|nr:phosphate ABC transporter permease PstA [Gemmataceae bacterium]
MSPRQSLWQVVVPTFGQMLQRALFRSLLTAAVISVAYCGVNPIWMIFQPERPSILGLIVQSGALFAIVWGLSFPLFLIAASRVWADRAFTAAGFLATFFGLAILIVFFVRLADEVRLWFHYTPTLVQKQNEKNQERLANSDEGKRAEQMEARIAKSIKERDARLAEAKTAEDKKAIVSAYDTAIAMQKDDLKKTLDELKHISEKSLRPDTSNVGIVAYFLTSSTSNYPQDAGIAPALWGSIWLGIITVLFAVPVGVGAALYLEEYRSEGWLAKVIQININNLAGVPSVVYGILGGFVFVYIFQQLQHIHSDVAARNLLGGGLTLGLLTLPMIIVSAQEAIRAVPVSLKQGAYALGATKWQVMWNIVLPMARPGILTGTILALSRAIGEAAPLVLFGAQLFVDQNPSLLSRFTALPLQIFNWCDRPPYQAEGTNEVIDIWKYNAALASSVLLLVLLTMNAIAIFLRNRAQRKMRY